MAEKEKAGEEERRRGEEERRRGGETERRRDREKFINKDFTKREER